MLALEAAQVAAKAGLEKRVALSTRQGQRRAIAEMLARDHISVRLRQALQAADSRAGGTIICSPPPPAATPPEFSAAMSAHFLEQARKPLVPTRPFRWLRIYAYDPGQQTRPDLFDVSIAT
jgi:hypothetical protein